MKNEIHTIADLMPGDILISLKKDVLIYSSRNECVHFPFAGRIPTTPECVRLCAPLVGGKNPLDKAFFFETEEVRTFISEVYRGWFECLDGYSTGVGPNQGVGMGLSIRAHRIWARSLVKPEIEITVKVNGKEVLLSDISEETLLKLRGIKHA